MADLRHIRKVVKSRPTLEGAGVHLHRAIGLGPPEEYDPFLLLDDFRSDDPDQYHNGFPWHPHRGMETITYVLRGEVAHADNLGNRDAIRAGDVQWMTAGSGIIHQEMPEGDAANKMMAPRYRGVRSAEIPEVTDAGGATIKIIAGTAGGVTGPVRDVVTSPEYLDIRLPAGKSFTHPTPRGHTVFAYVIGGKGVFCQQKDPYSYEVEGQNYFDMERDCLCGPENLVHYGEGDAVSVTAEKEPVRFLLVSGKPIGEPVAWYGPIVMNTAEEIRIAFEEYRKGTFIKHR